MRAKILIIVLILLVIGAGGYMYYYFYTPDISMQFEENKQEVINPSRGFYYQVDTSKEKLPKAIAENQIKIVLLTFDLKEEKTNTISENKMKELKTSLEKIKEQELKIIFRAAYGFSSEDAYTDPNDIEIIVSHIRQIAPLLNFYKENILCVQAGFLGPWGEWHDSNLLGENEEKNTIVRNRVIFEWLSCLEKPLKVNVRRPRFIRDAMAAGIDESRLGIHNDALLAGDSDMGTYDDKEYTRQQELNWMRKNIKNGINGGEMPQISEYTKAEKAILEFEKIHLTYLNSTYNKEVLEDWKKRKIGEESAYDVISRRLGYRLSLKECRINSNIHIGILNKIFNTQKIRIALTLQNTGFAPMPEQYKAYIIVENEKETAFYLLEQEKEEGIDLGETKFWTEIKLSDFYSNKKSESKVLKLGILITDSLNLDSKNNRIELANDKLIWDKGINYFGEYQLQNKKYIFNNNGYEKVYENQTKIGNKTEIETETKIENKTNMEAETQLEEKSEKMQMIIFKIGKADAILLRSKEETVLIDTGEEEDADEILDYLEQIGETKIDYLILTHFDKDHVGGADKILEKIEVGQIYQPDYENDSKEYKEYQKMVKKEEILVKQLTETIKFNCGDMKICIYPPIKKNYEEKNDFSMITSVTYGQNKFLFAGDAEEERLKEFIEESENIEELKHDFLKVPHHGRYNNQLESFFEKINPSYAVITCSAKNPPDDEVISLLEQKETKVFLTRNGNIYINSDGENISIYQ